MSINGIPGSPGGLRSPLDVQRGQVEQERAGRAGGAAAPVQQPPLARPPLSATRPSASLTAEAPPGTDPELWSILTAEERTYFAKLGAMGPLTYGRVSSEMNAQPPVTRGGRLNVRA